tara:strand:+ start:397 stop:918 length:522 start_codon:yes stop_codon:yes gene_type:complete
LAYLDECFRLDDGRLIWRDDRPAHHFASERTRQRSTTRLGGKEAGTNNRGYRRIRMDSCGTVYAHRIIYAMHHRALPDPHLEIDHIDGDRLNNNPENLRLVTASVNQRNQTKYANNTSGVNGVSWEKSRQKWRAYIRIRNVQLHLGCFATKPEAIAARQTADAEYGFTERHGQ